jgi:hypothetical protein
MLDGRLGLRSALQCSSRSRKGPASALQNRTCSPAAAVTSRIPHTQFALLPTPPAPWQRPRTRGSGKFRFWHDERRFKGSSDRCVVQQALFDAGGARTGGYPKCSPLPGPLGHQRPSDWDLLWSPARTALKAVPALKLGQLVSALPGMMSITKKARGLEGLRGGRCRGGASRSSGQAHGQRHWCLPAAIPSRLCRQDANCRCTLGYAPALVVGASTSRPASRLPCRPAPLRASPRSGGSA